MAICWWFHKPTAISSVADPLSVASSPKSDAAQATPTTRSALTPLATSSLWPTQLGVKPQAPALNFADALKVYNPDEQQYLKHINDLTHGLLDFSSPED